MIITERGMKILEMDSRWQEYAKAQGIRDPFQVSQMLFSKRCRKYDNGALSVKIDLDENGNIKEDPNEPTRKEKDEYIKRKDQFLADIYYKEIDYDAFLMKTEKEENRYLRQLAQYVPCGAADGQCRFECPMYGQCMKGEPWRLLEKV